MRREASGRFGNALKVCEQCDWRVETKAPIKWQPIASIQGNDYRLATHYRGSKYFIGGAEVFALWFIWGVGSYYKSKFWYVRRPPLEHGADRLTPSPDMDCDRLRQA